MAGTRSVSLAINDFAENVGKTVEMNGTDNHPDVALLIKGLTEELQEHTKTKIHPLIYANLAFIVLIIFTSGVLWNRVSTIEAKAQSLDAIQVVSVKVDVMQVELGRLRDRLDKLLEDQSQRDGKK
jgi:hypothetical protein